MHTEIRTLGPPRYDSPVKGQRFARDEDRVLFDTSPTSLDRSSFELAGPRERIFFNPDELGCAIVTCGGLCPGLNDVVRGIVLALWHGYGVKRIYGARHGFRGLVEDEDYGPIELSPDAVRGIHNQGGTMLGTSRGPQDPGAIADWLKARDVGVLFAIGGDGTLKGTVAIEEELARRGQPCAVIGIPKTIDNDIALAARSFGFETAVERARDAISSAHVEATCAVRGVGVVKLMGRHAGFIAATATLAQSDVNACLIPEADFDVDGEHGLLAFIERRLNERDHAVIVVAEGAGQRYFDPATLGVDASGNTKLGDIQAYLATRIKERFADMSGFALKSIDPSYIIRSGPSNSNDSVFCNFLAYNAVHAGLAGKTGLMTSVWNNNYVHVPIKEAVARAKRVGIDGRLWGHVLEMTGQPTFLPG